MTEPTAEPIEILWTLANLIGAVAALGLVAITWRRRVAVLAEEEPQTPKGPRLRNAHRQLRDRGGRAIFHLVAVLLGFMAMADIPWLDAIAGWTLFVICTVLMVISVVDLTEEAARR